LGVGFGVGVGAGASIVIVIDPPDTWLLNFLVSAATKFTACVPAASFVA
jgi:hypothetical protein